MEDISAMDDLFLVFDSYVRWLGQALSSFRGHWFTQILLFLLIFGLIVDVIIVFRGGH